MSSPSNAAGVFRGARQHCAFSGGSPETETAITDSDFRKMFEVIEHDQKEFSDKFPDCKEPGVIETLALTNIKINLRSKRLNEGRLRESIKSWFNVFRGENNDASSQLLKRDKEDSSIKTVLTKYFNERCPEYRDAAPPFPDYPRGMLVTDRSDQDLAFYMPSNKILFEGEVIHNPRYDAEAARRQCAGYAFAQLWWFRTYLGLDVQQVYGFTIRSQRCQGVGENQVELELLILKVPQTNKFCEKMELHVYPFIKTLKFFKVGFMQPLRSFLKHTLSDPFQSSSIGQEYKHPGGMMYPTTPDFGAVEIMPTGTASLVIKCPGDECIELLENSIKEGDREDLVSTLNGSETYYLKFKNLGTGQLWHKRNLENALLRAFRKPDKTWSEEILGMYPNMLSIHIGTAFSGILWISRDMGSIFRGNEHIGTFQSFDTEFYSLSERTLEIERNLDIVHGDLHRGNLVFDDKRADGRKLWFIDWDEGFAKSEKHYRVAVTAAQKSRYDNTIPIANNQYTKHQLKILYLELVKDCYPDAYLQLKGRSDFGARLNDMSMALEEEEEEEILV